MNDMASNIQQDATTVSTSRKPKAAKGLIDMADGTLKINGSVERFSDYPASVQCFLALYGLRALSRTVPESEMVKLFGELRGGAIPGRKPRGSGKSADFWTQAIEEALIAASNGTMTAAQAKEKVGTLTPAQMREIKRDPGVAQRYATLSGTRAGSSLLSSLVAPSAA